MKSLELQKRKITRKKAIQSEMQDNYGNVLPVVILRSNFVEMRYNKNCKQKSMIELILIMPI